MKLSYYFGIKTSAHHFVAIAVIAILGISGLAAGGVLTGMLISEAPEPVPVQMLLGVEAPEGAKVNFELFTKNDAGVFNVSHNARTPIYVSLPDVWIRRSVKNTVLDRVNAGRMGLQTTRWRIPVGSEVSFGIPNVPDILEVASPDQNPFMVNIEYVDVNTESVERTSVLIQERGVVWEQ